MDILLQFAGLCRISVGEWKTEKKEIDDSLCNSRPIRHLPFVCQEESGTPFELDR